ncbi:MAG: hypothetical protein AAFY08_07475 [Planctomycetota bacterium]
MTEQDIERIADQVADQLAKRSRDPIWLRILKIAPVVVVGIILFALVGYVAFHTLSPRPRLVAVSSTAALEDQGYSSHVVVHELERFLSALSTPDAIQSIGEDSLTGGLTDEISRNQRNIPAVNAELIGTGISLDAIVTLTRAFAWQRDNRVFVSVIQTDRGAEVRLRGVRDRGLPNHLPHLDGFDAQVRLAAARLFVDWYERDDNERQQACAIVMSDLLRNDPQAFAAMSNWAVRHSRYRDADWLMKRITHHAERYASSIKRLDDQQSPSDPRIDLTSSPAVRHAWEYYARLIETEPDSESITDWTKAKLVLSDALGKVDQAASNANSLVEMHSPDDSTNDQGSPLTRYVAGNPEILRQVATSETQDPAKVDQKQAFVEQAVTYRATKSILPDQAKSVLELAEEVEVKLTGPLKARLEELTAQHSSAPTD